jgi:hypothetical protein
MGGSLDNGIYRKAQRSVIASYTQSPHHPLEGQSTDHRDDALDLSSQIQLGFSESCSLRLLSSCSGKVRSLSLYLLRAFHIETCVVGLSGDMCCC